MISIHRHRLNSNDIYKDWCVVTTMGITKEYLTAIYESD